MSEICIISTTKQIVVFVLCGLLLVACEEQQHARPGILRIGVQPDAAPDIIKDKYSPLIEYLHRDTGITTELVIPKNYDELVTLLHHKAIDLAFLGGYTYVLAHDRDHVVPLAMRDIDLQLTSLFLVRPNDPAVTLEDLKDKRFTFGSRLSTAGHLMPRFFLREHGIVPEKFFSQILYSGAHDNTAYWVRDGKVDAGVANSEVIRKMFTDDKLGVNDVRILWETPAFPDYVWAAQEDLDPGRRQKILDSLLSLSIANPEHSLILEAVGAQRKFLPALDEDFNLEREAIKLINNTK